MNANETLLLTDEFFASWRLERSGRETHGLSSMPSGLSLIPLKVRSSEFASAVRMFRLYGVKDAGLAPGFRIYLFSGAIYVDKPPEMINALLLLISPGPTWKRLASANRSAWVVFLFSFLPVLLIACSFEAWALWAFGDYNSSIQRQQKVELDLAIRYGTSQVLMGIVSLLVASIAIINVTRGIAIRTSFSQVFITLAYSFSSLYLFRFLDAWIFMNTWVVCAIAIVFAFGVLYTAMPHFIKPDPAKAFGLYLTMVVILSACYLSAQIFASLVLSGKLVGKGLGLNVLGF